MQRLLFLVQRIRYAVSTGEHDAAMGVADGAPVTAGDAPAYSRHWLFASALILGAVLWLFAWYWDTAQAMVATWIRSETFAHGFLILPIVAWLIWQRRHAVGVLDPRPGLLALPLLAVAGFGWLLGQLAGAAVVKQFGLVLMIPLLVWTILGTQVVRTLAFPLFYLLFAVPFGDFLEPLLMEHTADFVVFALQLTGIPVYREGQFLNIPSGNWSVVEACSGLRYLIASLTLGFLYAYLTYRSFKRRAIFIAFSVIVPIIANWVRAYMIVMIGHLSGMKYAVGVDHLIYGWVFFGLVMILLFWVGSYWREDIGPDPVAPGSLAREHQAPRSLTAVAAATIAAAAVVALWPMAAARLEIHDPDTSLSLKVPPSAGGWQPAEVSPTDWRPPIRNPRIQIRQPYLKAAVRAGLAIGYYRNQGQETQLISSQNTLVPSTEREWKNIGETRRTVAVNDQSIALIESQLRGQFTHMLVWRWYWVDGQYTVHSYWAKLLQARSRLLGRGDGGAVIILYTGFDKDREAAAGTLRDFASAMLPAIGESLDHAHAR